MDRVVCASFGTMPSITACQWRMSRPERGALPRSVDFLRAPCLRHVEATGAFRMRTWGLLWCPWLLSGSACMEERTTVAYTGAWLFISDRDGAGLTPVASELPRQGQAS